MNGIKLKNRRGELLHLKHFMFKRVMATLGLLGVLALYVLVFDWILFKSGVFFIGYGHFMEGLPNLEKILEEVSTFLFMILAIRGFASIFQSLKPIPKNLYEHWPKPVKILAVIVIIFIITVMYGLAGEYIRSLA